MSQVLSPGQGGAPPAGSQQTNSVSAGQIIPVTQASSGSGRKSKHYPLNEVIKKVTAKNGEGINKLGINKLLEQIDPLKNNSSNVVTVTPSKSSEVTQRFEFNLMYLIDPDISKKYYEIFTTYQMLLHTLDNIRYYMTMNRNELYKMVGIREKINMRSLVYQHKVISGEERPENFIPGYSYFRGGVQDVSYLFGINPEKMNKDKKDMASENIYKAQEMGKRFRKEVSKHFERYRSQQSLFSFEDVGRSQIPVFQYLIKNYVEDRNLKDILIKMCTSYTQFKMKILELMTDPTSRGLLFGLMTYGFLFTNKYFPKMHPTDPNNIFMDPQLYDMGDQKVNVNDLAMSMSKRIFEMGDNLRDKLNYFYTGQYRDTILFEVIMTAMDMDLAGLQMLLYYAHPDYLRLFLKRKEYIDRQITNYIGSFDVEDLSTGFDKIPIYKSFIENPEGLFSTYPAFLINQSSKR
jgi:hypothetical protein